MARLIIDTLTTYTDTELAYLSKFRIASYLPATQKKIKRYIFVTRGLSESKIDSLIEANATNTFTDNKMRCPNCKSDKISHNTDKVDCDICGYMLADLQKENFLKEGKGLFFDFLGEI